MKWMRVLRGLWMFRRICRSERRKQDIWRGEITELQATLEAGPRGGIVESITKTCIRYRWKKIAESEAYLRSFITDD